MTTGPRPFNRALSDSEVREIRTLAANGTNRLAIAQLYGCSRITIDRIIQRVTYYNVTDVDGAALAANVRSPQLQPKVAPSAAHADDLLAKLMAAGLVQQAPAEPRADVPPPPNPMETGDLPK